MFANAIDDAELRVCNPSSRFYFPGEQFINTREPRELSRRTFTPRLDFTRNRRPPDT
jgi:hypothetical protein